jgi:23S rRNA (uridine2552-2'-O)-methyltransferase
MSRSKSSRQWLKEHFADPYVKKAQQQGYRSRAVYKLMDIQQRDKLIKPGMTVIDLGAAPGGWSQLLAKWVGEKGKVIALDVLPMIGIPQVEFIQGDFREPDIFQRLLDSLENYKVDVIVSDIAPNTSGQSSVDLPRMFYLAELSLQLAQQVLKKEGCLLIKLFQGSGYEEFVKEMRLSFKKIVVRKPDASRQRSPEVYLLARNFFAIK